jgi:hypothetical protein
LRSSRSGPPHVPFSPSASPCLTSCATRVQHRTHSVRYHLRRSRRFPAILPCSRVTRTLPPLLPALTLRFFTPQVEFLSHSLATLPRRVPGPWSVRPHPCAHSALCSPQPLPSFTAGVMPCCICAATGTRSAAAGHVPLRLRLALVVLAMRRCLHSYRVSQAFPFCRAPRCSFLSISSNIDALLQLRASGCLLLLLTLLFLFSLGF